MHLNLNIVSLKLHQVHSKLGVSTMISSTWMTLAKLRQGPTNPMEYRYSLFLIKDHVYRAYMSSFEVFYFE